MDVALVVSDEAQNAQRKVAAGPFAVAEAKSPSASADTLEFESQTKQPTVNAEPVAVAVAGS